MELEIPVNARNRDPRCPLVFLADTSAGFAALAQALQINVVARKRIDIAFIGLGAEPQVVSPFSEARQVDPHVAFTAGGAVPNLAGGLHLALDYVNARRDLYIADQLEYFTPRIFLVLGVAPSEHGLSAALDRVRQAHEQREVVVRRFRSSAPGGTTALDAVPGIGRVLQLSDTQWDAVLSGRSMWFPFGSVFTSYSG